MARKTDIRVIKTLTKLRITLGDMLTEMPFDDISVLDLCVRSGIRRATFYKHFNDKHAFIAYIVSYVQKSLAENVSSDCDISTPVEYLCCYVKQIIAYFDSKQAILTNVFKGQTYTAIYNAITSTTYNALIETLNRAADNGVKVPTDIEFAAGFINGGLVYLIVDFLRYKRITEDELIEKCTKMLNKILN